MRKRPLEPSLPSSGIKALWHANRKLRYLLIGAWNTLAGYGIFAVLYQIMGQDIGYMGVAVLCHVLAVTQSFATQRHIVFRSTGSGWAKYFRFHIAHLGSLAAGLGALPILVEFFNVRPLIAQGAITATLVVASYFVHQHFTFRESHDA